MKEEGKTANKTLKEGSGGKHDVAAAKASAIQDDFYQQDVNELDYNPNEQSDDDDVDDGSEEVLMDDGGGFAADIDDSGSDDDDNKVGVDLELSGFGSSFATSAGMKAMIAKANGVEIQPPIVIAPITPLDKRSNLSDANTTSGSDRSDDESPAPGGIGKRGGSGAGTSGASTNPSSSCATQLDDDGLRIISKEALRRKIWIHKDEKVGQGL